MIYLLVTGSDISSSVTFCTWGGQWPGGRVSDSELRGPGFDPHWWHHVVSLSKTHELHRVLAATQEAVAPSHHD